jgi:hypothetical protein
LYSEIKDYDAKILELADGRSARGVLLRFIEGFERGDKAVHAVIRGNIMIICSGWLR